MAAGSATTEVLVNSLIIADSNAANGLVIYGFSANKTVSAVGCTVVKPTDFSGATGVAAQYGTGVEFKGSACFGFSAGTPFTGTFGGSSGYNCTDSATAPGSNNQVSKTYANQFENTTNASADFRAKTGGDLANNAIQFSETADLDIKKRARSVTTPTIGAWELAAAAAAFVINSVTPNVLYEGLTGVVIAGSGFGAVQGTKTVYLDDKLQTVTAWADTSITITAVSPNLWANARLLQVRNT
jgi:hypothetical protein